MPHFPKPFFRSSRAAWFVQVGSKQIRLGPDREEAFRLYHELMARPVEAAPAAPVRVELVAAVLDAFLDFVQRHRSPDTYRWYKDRLQRFLDFVPATLTTAQLKPFHVQQWIDAYPDLSSGSKRNYCRAVMRAMRWAEEQGYVDRSPLAHFRKPRAGRKEQVLTEREFQCLLSHVGDDAFRDLLVVTWETGCRPQESLRVEARHVDVAGSRWIFPASEAKGENCPRVVYLTATAMAITKQHMERHPAGPLFRNTGGMPWTPDATNCRFQTLKAKLRVKYSLYAIRHTWMNRMLVAGVDAFTVAILAGHKDPSMLAKHYQHLSQSPGFLLQQLSRASA